MAFVTIKQGTLLSPAPAVMVSCATETQRPNIITIAWAGTVNSSPPMVSISVRSNRFSHHIIKESGEFVINLVSRELVKATDFCGVKSGKDIDKFDACQLTPLKLDSMQHAPAIQEAPFYLACKVEQTIDLPSHTMFIAQVVENGVREDLMEIDGRIAMERADLTAYCHGEYYGLDKRLGFFGFSVARPEALARRMGKQSNKK